MKLIIFSLTAGLVLATGAVRADSLYPGSSTAAPGQAAAVSLFADNKARRVGDTLTILIQETASAASQANTTTSKKENFNFGPGLGPLLSNIKAFGLNSGISSNAAGSTNRSDNLNARIAVTVTQVLPNGNLVIEGARKVGINAETQTITLTGVVRPQDIQPDNTIPSPLVADAQIRYNGKGPVGDKQHDGIISRIFRFLF